MKIIIIIYLLLNIVSFFVYGIDKYKAIKHKWRISEKNLIKISLFAPTGAYIGMLIFRHKIRKNKFRFSIPFFTLIHIAIIAYLCSKIPFL